MSYNPALPPSMVTMGGLNGDLAKLWFYSSADTNVAGNYFSNGYTLGMRVGDYVIATDTTSPAVNFHRVTAVQAPPDPNQPNSTRYATLSTGIKIGN